MNNDEEKSGIVLRSTLEREVVAEFVPAPSEGSRTKGAVQDAVAEPVVEQLKTHSPGISAHQLASAIAYVAQVLPKSDEDHKLRRIYLSTEPAPGIGGKRLVLSAFDTHRAHEAYVSLPEGVDVVAQAISSDRAERLRLECETAIKTGYTSSVHVLSALRWEMHDGFEPKVLELGIVFDGDTWRIPPAFDGPPPPKKHELKHGRAALSYKASEDSPPCERSFVDGHGFKFVVLSDGSGVEVARARIAPLGWHDEEPGKTDKRQATIPGTMPAGNAAPKPTALGLAAPAKPEGKPKRTKASKGASKPSKGKRKPKNND